MNTVDCINCGWSCRRVQCSLAIYLDGPIKGPCKHLTQVEDKYLCGLILNEKDEAKKWAIKELILSNRGCTHQFAPHPVSLIKEMIKKGHRFSNSQLVEMKNQMTQKMDQMKLETNDPESITIAIQELNEFINNTISTNLNEVNI